MIIIRKNSKPLKNARMLGLVLILAIMYNHINYIVQSLIILFKLFLKVELLLIVVTAIFATVQFIYHHHKWENADYTCFNMSRKIRSMSPRQFEVFIANLFTQLGYEAEATAPTCDGGKDVIAINDEEKIYIECKHWNIDHMIGREILQKLVGSAVGDDATRAIVVTTTKYHKNAYEYAKKVPWLELWTINDIIRALNKIEDSKKGYVLNYLEG